MSYGHRDPRIRDFLPDPSCFQDMDKGAKRLADAVQQSETIAIFGDYDVDGATSAALVVSHACDSDSGSYDCTVVTACGELTTNAATPKSRWRAPGSGTACNSMSLAFAEPPNRTSKSCVKPLELTRNS